MSSLMLDLFSDLIINFLEIIYVSHIFSVDCIYETYKSVFSIVIGISYFDHDIVSAVPLVLCYEG